jgi:hypothetical protein
MYHTDDLLRKHHLLIEDTTVEDDTEPRVRLVGWETCEVAHPDQALGYLAELAHGHQGFQDPNSPRNYSRG